MNDQSPTPAKSPGGTGVVVVGICVALWWPAFTLGAWGTLFFPELITVWIAASAALVVVLIQAGKHRGRVWKAIALCVPSIWLALALSSTPDQSDSWGTIIDLLGAVVGLLGIPLTLVVLARIVWPDFGEGLNVIRRVVVVAAIAALTFASFELGVHESSFLTCGDFSISGNSLPPGCNSAG